MTSLSLPANVLVLSLGAALGLLDARRVSRAHPEFNLDSGLRHARHLLLLMAPLIGLLLFHFLGQRNAKISWLFPLWLELYYTAIAWGIVLAGFSFLFAFGLFMAFRDGHKERWKLGVAALMLIGTVEWNQWAVTRPAIPGPPAQSEGVILQTHGSTCAAASSANLLRSLGRAATEAEMIALLGTTKAGTSTAQIIVGLGEVGIRCEKIQREDPLKLKTPAILFVDHPAAGPESHAVFYAGVQDGIVEYHDPIDGPHRVEPSALKAIWPGRAVECTPQP